MITKWSFSFCHWYMWQCYYHPLRGIYHFRGPYRKPLQGKQAVLGDCEEGQRKQPHTLYAPPTFLQLQISKHNWGFFVLHVFYGQVVLLINDPGHTQSILCCLGSSIPKCAQKASEQTNKQTDRQKRTISSDQRLSWRHTITMNITESS